MLEQYFNLIFEEHSEAVCIFGPFSFYPFDPLAIKRSPYQLINKLMDQNRHFYFILP